MCVRWGNAFFGFFVYCVSSVVVADSFFFCVDARCSLGLFWGVHGCWLYPCDGDVPAWGGRKDDAVGAGL